MPTFARWIALPENSLARAASDRIADAVSAGCAAAELNPLFLHGPSGTGKSYLASALITAVTARAPDRIALQRSAGDIVPLRSSDSSVNDDVTAARDADLVVIDDLQHLHERSFDTFVHLLDRGLARGQQWVITAGEGPGRLPRLPGRLTNRLASGLVVGIDSFSPTSRRTALAALARQRGLNVPAGILDWLVDRSTGSFRDLEGVINRLGTLAELHQGIPALEIICEQFASDGAGRRATVEHIVQRVGRYFHIDPGQLQGPSRTRSVLWPRHVGMYLARQLTALSLEQIGAYFGGRDHSTVLHACRKVEEALDRDVLLSGAVRQLHADLA